MREGSCVLTIMMLDWFIPGGLPDSRGGVHDLTDVSTYNKIFTAAKAIETQCTENRFPGWAMIGE